MRIFVRYLRAVFSTAWGVLFVIAGVLSTVVTFVLIYRPHFVLPYWVPAVLSIVAWLMAPYRLYQEQRNRIEALEAFNQKQRRAELVLIEETGSFYIRCFTPAGMTPKRETGIYLELCVSVENKGERSSTINHYDLRIEELGEFKAQRPSPQSYVLCRTSQYGLNISERVKNYIEVQAERIAPNQRIPFMLNMPLATSDRQIHCQLDIGDSEGNSATIQLVVTEML